MQTYLKKGGRMVPTTSAFQTQKFPGKYSTGDMEHGVPMPSPNTMHRTLKAARARAYELTRKYGMETYVFVPCGYYTVDKQAVVTHYVPVGRVIMVLGANGYEFVWQEESYEKGTGKIRGPKTILRKDGTLGRRA